MRTTLLLLLAASTCLAGTLLDPFHQSQAGGCHLSYTPPFSTCDVIGDPARFDVEKADAHFSPGWVQVTVYFNYGGSLALEPFADGIPLQVGDLFFYDPGDPSHTYQYGVPLHSHGNFQAGELYRIGGPATVLTAGDVIHNTRYYYRRTQGVWLGGAGFVEAHGLPVSVVPYGNGITHAELSATIQFPSTAAFLDAVLDHDRVGIAFSSAYCGNDVIEGDVAVAPEPAPFVLVLGGALMIAAARYARRRRAKPGVTSRARLPHPGDPRL